MDTKQLDDLISRLSALDAAEAPDVADQIADILAGGLEESGEPTGESID